MVQTAVSALVLVRTALGAIVLVQTAQGPVLDSYSQTTLIKFKTPCCSKTGNQL